MPRRIINLVRKNQSISLRLRLTLWTTLIFTVILWVAGSVFWLYQSASISRIFNNILAQRGTMLASNLTKNLPGVTRKMLDDRAEEVSRSVQFEYIAIDLFDAAGNHAISDSPPIINAGSLPIAQALENINPILISNPQWLGTPPWSENIGSRAIIIGMTGRDGRPYVMVIATTDRFAQEQIALVSKVLFTAGAIAPLVSCLSGWFIAGIAVAPFNKLQELARKFGPESLGESIEVGRTGSEVAELAEQLNESRIRIQNAFAAKERFLSNVSHEIKTPIAVMLIEAQTLDIGGAPDDFVYFVGSVREEMSRLGKLVESFLTLTRIEDGHGRVRGKVYAVNDLVMDSVEQCAVMANQNAVWLRPRLFDTDETMETAVTGDPELLTTMLDNLIRNAIRFSPANAGVNIELSIDEERLLISVVDEGPGIPTEKLVNIFDRFAQASSGSRSGRGHGLGLAIAKGIAELHGGTVVASNNARQGCTFQIMLPLFKEEALEADETPESLELVREE